MKKFSKFNYSKVRGFTLLELLVVFAILGLAAALVAPQVFKQLSGAKSKAARVQIENLSTALDLYKLETGSYPDKLEALIKAPAGSSRWNGPYLKKAVLPQDPWGKDYIYTFPGKHATYDLLSYGADGAQGGSGEDEDIVSWQ